MAHERGFPDETRTDVWLAMAEHFLDTETRHDIPLTALCCLRAGYTVDEARQIWETEVTPALSFNLQSIAGEWTGWDREWLCARIAERRVRPGARWLRRLRYRVQSLGVHGVWLAIERCMAALLAVPPATREARMRDLHGLARHYFDFNPHDLRDRPVEERERLGGLRELALYALDPAVLSGERSAPRERVERALAPGSPPPTATGFDP